jgi:16S rRNA (adenine1518-N6/adenine1519-N6)-dimethyltransferase
VIERIIATAEIGPESQVLEIGPGLGALTEPLLQTGALVTAIERDDLLAERLMRRHPTLTVISANALTADLQQICAEGRWRCVANLPYNVGTPIMQRLIRRSDRFDRLILMLQKEVVDRLISPPGSKRYGALTLHVGAYAAVELAFIVSPGAFHPRPKVDSAVTRFDLFPTPRVGTASPTTFHAIVKAAFATRRKTLRNNLKAIYGAERAVEILEAAQVDPGERAERLDHEAFIRLAEAASQGASR